MHAQWFSTDWIRELYVQETVTKEPRVAYCECGTFWANTQHGKREHRRNCSIFGSLNSFARLQPGHERCMPEQIRCENLDVRINEAEQILLGISEVAFTPVECGSGVRYREGKLLVSDGNMCFYLSACQAATEVREQTVSHARREQDMRAAVALKRKLGHAAVAIARERGNNTANFLDPMVMAEEEILMAHATLVGPIVIVKVFSNRVCTALRYENVQASAEIRTHPNTYVIHQNNHYRMLQRALDPSTPPEPAVSPNATNKCPGSGSDSGSGPGSGSGSSSGSGPGSGSGSGSGSRSGPGSSSGSCAASNSDSGSSPSFSSDSGSANQQHNGSQMALGAPVGLELYFDGGSRGNPGIAGAGATLTLISDQKRQRLADVTHFVGVNETNNAAEYSGLVRGLEAISELADHHDLPPMPVQVFGDSMLVIRQAKGEWECNHAGLQDRLRQAQLLLQTLAKRG